jgi:hypothetical protein
MSIPEIMLPDTPVLTATVRLQIRKLADERYLRHSKKQVWAVFHDDSFAAVSVAT